MPHVHKLQTPETDDCIHTCEDVHDACQHAIHDCLKKGGPHASPKHIGILLDCAQVAHTAHDFMLRHSEQHEITCRACAEICDACAKACEQAGDDELAHLCRRCASACRKPHSFPA